MHKQRFLNQIPSKPSSPSHTAPSGQQPNNGAQRLRWAPQKGHNLVGSGMAPFDSLLFCKSFFRCLLFLLQPLGFSRWWIDLASLCWSPSFLLKVWFPYALGFFGVGISSLVWLLLIVQKGHLLELRFIKIGSWLTYSNRTGNLRPPYLHEISTLLSLLL